jgi:hypothetical protein
MLGISSWARGRAPFWLSALAALFVVALGLVAARPASAADMPQTDWSFYVTNISTSEAHTLGCNQGKFDADHGDIDSTVTLDFGGQNSSNNGTILVFSGTPVSYGDVESFAETFGYWYWDCTGADTTSLLTLSVGTNTSAYYVDSAGGASWAGVVNAVADYMDSYGQVQVWGGDDMELAWATYAATSSWESGYAAHTSQDYTDYGDANSCPPYGSCYGSWTQHDVYLLAWGDTPAWATPEIYYTADASEWISISDTYGPIDFWGPMDEYDLDSSTLTPAQAWSALCSSQTCEYSLQIHEET